MTATLQHSGDIGERDRLRFPVVRPATILVVGGTGALGRAVCRALSRSWAAVAFTSFSGGAKAEALAAELEPQCTVAWRQADLRQEADVAAAMELGSDAAPLQGVVFAAGADIEQPFVSTIGQDQWESVLDLELNGFIRLARLALPRLRTSGGVIVSIGSFATHRFPPGDAISAVPKAGIEMLTRAIAREEGRYGIRANTVAPGVIDDGLGKAMQEKVFTPEIWDQQRQRVPLRRFGAADEVASVVDFLASEQSSYVTGQTILVDGGLSI